MILTGKLEKDFTTWLVYHDVIIKHGGSYDDIWHNEDVTIYGYFDKLPKCAQHSIIIKFLNEKCIWQNVVSDILKFDKNYFINGDWEDNINLLIITANEIYNSK